MTKRALICGITGQDGAYLAELLLGLDPTFVPPGAISERVILSAEHVGSLDSA